MRRFPFKLTVVATLAGLAALLVILSQAERPPVGNIVHGPRGAGMLYVYNPRTMAGLAEVNTIPDFVPEAVDQGVKASAVYQNVRVLGDVDAGEFTRLMVNMTNWVVGDEGCGGCHDLNNFADDGKYGKVVARRMLQMVRHINSDWTTHVAQTGVTCYTCHRGQRVPANVWFNNPGPKQAGGVAQVPAGKNHPTGIARYSALPSDPFTPFLQGATDIRVQSTTALRADDQKSIKQAEWTYALMMNISQSLGVNCDYCHNTRSFVDWAGSPPQRVTAWYGIRMVRDLNNNFLDPLRTVFPPERLGALGDSPKVNCATCHNGVFKPLFGVSMVKDFPELRGTPTL